MQVLNKIRIFQTAFQTINFFSKQRSIFENLIWLGKKIYT